MSSPAAPLASLDRPAWLPPDVWPFESATIDVNDTTVAVTDIGHGPTLLFYTGIGSFVWRDVLLELAADFRCVVLDPPGIGLSGAVRRAETTMQRSSEAVAATIRTLDLRGLALVVHDSGGPPALAAAARTADRVRGLVAVNTFGWRPSTFTFRALLALFGSGLFRRLDLATGLIPRLTATSFGVGRHLDPASRRAFRAGIARGLGAFHDYLRDALRSDTLYAEVGTAFAGRLGALPLLTIFGERNDPFRFQARWKRLFPRARQVVVPRGNHFPMCDDPALVASAIRDWHRAFIGGQ
jgi:haloalkane dehalogenase